MKKKITYIILLFFCLSCGRKDESVKLVKSKSASGHINLDTESLQDAMEAHALFYDIERLVIMALQGAKFSCPTYKRDNKIMLLDFGKNGCKDDKGWIRYGKISVSINNSLLKKDGKAIVTLENYHVKAPLITKKELTGTIIISHVDLTDKGIITLDTKVNEGKIIVIQEEKVVDRKVILWNAILRRNFSLRSTEFAEAVKMTGNMYGVNKSNTQFKTIIKKELLIKLPCIQEGAFYPSKGTVDLTSLEKIKNVDFKPVSDQENNECNRVISIFCEGEYFLLDL